jgi:sigma-B regulation protein RsbU (phosphoserine phosphatase)
MSEDLQAALLRLQAENAELKAQLESKAKVATRALAAYQRRVERLAEALNRLEERDLRISEDLEEARRFQSLLLTTSTQLPGMSLAALYRPAEVVGGDVYDVSALPDGRVRAFIADATGHGIQAALRTMILKSEYDRLRGIVATPTLLLETLSERLAVNYPGLELRSTAACVDFIRGSAGMTLRYASCAHPPLLLVEPDGAVEELYQPGPFLGASAGARLSIGERNVAKGTRLALYSDGIVEQWDDKGTTFGIGPLVEAMRTRAPLREGLNALEARLIGFAGVRGLDDDATVVALEID